MNPESTPEQNKKITSTEILEMHLDAQKRAARTLNEDERKKIIAEESEAGVSHIEENLEDEAA